jgi:cytochrome c peroxidase
MKKLTPFLLITFVFIMFSCTDNSVIVHEQNLTPELPNETFIYITDEVKDQFMGTIIGRPNIDFTSSINVMDMSFLSSNAFNEPVTAIHPDQLTDEIATLGRVLFYDTKLSVNNSISCGTCHKQSLGFADDTPLTPGFKGEMTDRNTISIANTMTQDGFFWNNNVAMLEDQVLNPVQNHKEMGMEDLSLLPGKLYKADYYPGLFEKAFGSPQVTNEKISEALTQFMISMVSSSSKFSQFADQIQQGIPEHQAGLSPLELAGFQVFNSEQMKCASCHKLPKLATRSVIEDGSYESDFSNFVNESLTAGPGSNIGLDSRNPDAGNGENGFKIPSLINVSVTAPYMHDGRFDSIEEVLDHYSKGIKDNPALDSRLRDASGQPMRMNMTEYEKQALIAFLHTLTDEEYLAAERFSDPFER